MRYRPFGRSGLALSTIGLHVPTQVFSRAGLGEKLLTAALENGINTYHFDTANPAALSLAAGVFSVVERRLLFISLSACDPETANDGMVYELAPLKDRLRVAIKDSGLLWLDLVMFDKAGTSHIPDRSMDFVKTLQRSKMLRYTGAQAETENMADLIQGRRFDVIRTRFDIDSSWDKRRQIDAAIASDMAVFADGTFPDAYRRASDLIPSQAKRGWFGAKPKNPLAGAGTYAFLHQTPEWTPEELCLGYALSQPSLSCIFISPQSPEELEALAGVPERHMPSSVPAQIEMARFTDHVPPGR